MATGKIKWFNPTKGDWTEYVKQDLRDFKIELNEITSKSKNTVKDILKIKAKEYALKVLQTKKEKHSKMDNLNYSKDRQGKPEKWSE